MDMNEYKSRLCSIIADLLNLFAEIEAEAEKKEVES